MKYPFEKHFLVCTGARCNDNKHGDDRGEIIRDELKDLNKSLGRKPIVRICAVSCLDLCDYGPNMIAYPGGTTYAHLNVKRAIRAYKGEMGDAALATDLELEKK